MGRRALHDINGTTIMVIRREVRHSMVRHAKTAGTLQPKPMTIGMNDLPCTPMRCITLSMINAARAKYPESSKKEMKRYRIMMLGKKTSTLPTPLITPSVSISRSAPASIALCTAL